KRILAVAAVVLVAAIGGTAIFLAAKPPADAQRMPSGDPTWTEAAWPFPIDQWGRGKAFQCKAADCGTEVTVYIRAKIGFCNCSTGVADDEELDRISDFDLLGNQLTAQGPGQPIAVAWMKGRSRAFSVGGAQRPAK